MSDRKYRQRGYQDEPREPRREQRPPEKKEYAPRGQPPDCAQNLQHAGFPRGRSLRPLRQRADGRGGVERRKAPARAAARSCTLVRSA